MCKITNRGPLIWLTAGREDVRKYFLLSCRFLKAKKLLIFFSLRNECLDVHVYNWPKSKWHSLMSESVLLSQFWICPRGTWVFSVDELRLLWARWQSSSDSAVCFQLWASRPEQKRLEQNLFFSRTEPKQVISEVQICWFISHSIHLRHTWYLWNAAMAMLWIRGSTEPFCKSAFVLNNWILLAEMLHLNIINQGWCDSWNVCRDVFGTAEKLRCLLPFCSNSFLFLFPASCWAPEVSHLHRV